MKRVVGVAEGEYSPRFVCLLRINGGQTNRGYFRILGWVGGLSLEGFICELTLNRMRVSETVAFS